MTNDIDISEYMNDIKKWCNDPEQLLEYEKNIKDSIINNQEINEYLSTTFSVSDEIWNSISSSIYYDAATTVNWAVKKLEILYKRIMAGEKIYIPSLNTYLGSSNFKRIICKEYSKFIFDEIIENT